MKLIAGAAIACVCLAAGLAVAVTEKSKHLKDFVYETATADEQTEWLYRQGKLYRRDIAGNLPNGWGSAPRLEVIGVDVDRAARVIHYRIAAREQAHLADDAATIEHKWLKQACLTFIHGTLYRTGVSVIDSFHLMDGSRVFQAVISPSRCDAIYPPVKLSGDMS